MINERVQGCIADTLTIVRWKDLSDVRNSADRNCRTRLNPENRNMGITTLTFGHLSDSKSAQLGQARYPCWASTLPMLGKHRAQFQPKSVIRPFYVFLYTACSLLFFIMRLLSVFNSHQPAITHIKIQTKSTQALMTDSGLTQNNSANGFALYLNTEAVSALCARSSVRQYLKVMLIKLLIFSLDQPIAFLFLSSSRALPVISISLSGYPSLKHSNIASVAICLYFLLTLIRY